MVDDQQIPYGSKLFYQGVNQFVSNMNETLDLFNKNHIPVFVSNLVCNDRDLKPFVSILPDSIRFPGFGTNLANGIYAYEQGDWESASVFWNWQTKYMMHTRCAIFISGNLSVRQGIKQRRNFISPGPGTSTDCASAHLL